VVCEGEVGWGFFFFGLIWLMPDAMVRLVVNGWVNGGRWEVIRGCVLVPAFGWLWIYSFGRGAVVLCVV
jgi:hypothetical protein